MKDEHRAILELCHQLDDEAASQPLERHITKAGREMKGFIKRQRQQD